MTKLTQSRKRAPLFEGQPMLTHSKSVSPDRPDTISFAMRAGETDSGKATFFTMEMPIAEFDRAAAFLHDRRGFHDFTPTEDAKLMGEREVDLDAERGLTNEQQLAKALDFAFTMLKFNMPHDQQNGNSTLAYIAAVDAKAKGQ